ncbi:MAG TPA: phospholipase D-like domain-containing protein [Actinomycetota bacterium]|jgi:phosphatidylserine/phosphatidylglycerophosphate/cardiolipin synthase-like enzyme
MAVFAGGKIEAFVGPTELGASDDLEQVIVDFIGDATQTLDVAVQELDSLPIAQALLDARWRGVRIRVVLEQDYLQDESLPPVAPEPGESPELARWRAQWQQDPPRDLDANREILSALLRSDIDVRADYNGAIFHQKFVIRDYQGTTLPTSALLSGSANFTHTDGHTNLNHVVVFKDWRICAQYRAEFEQIREGRFGRGEHGDVPRAYSLNGVPVKILFAPDHTPELEIMKQLLKGTQRVDFAIFTFSGSSGIDDAMIMLRRAGLAVRGALDPMQAGQAWAAGRWLHDEGVELFVPRPAPGFRKLHHKLMVIDDAVVVAGSFNYTGPANDFNDENLFVLGSPYPDLPADEGGPVDPAACAAITAFFRDEVDRIVQGSDPFVP